jgi:hypothetical protein
MSLLPVYAFIAWADATLLFFTSGWFPYQFKRDQISILQENIFRKDYVRNVPNVSHIIRTYVNLWLRNHIFSFLEGMDDILIWHDANFTSDLSHPFLNMVLYYGVKLVFFCPNNALYYDV